MPSFGRSNTPAPPMPSKAAQVLGQEPRNPTKAEVRPIKPASEIKTPTKAPRSDTSKSLPAKLLSQSTYTRSHHTSAARRNRAANRRSPSGNKHTANAENLPPELSVNASFESAAPPTPPAKDTPPECKPAGRSASPLRRAPPGTNRLRDDYEADEGDGVMSQFPAFALSPSPGKAYNAEGAGKSPTKHLPCTANEYHKLIAGEPLPWASLAQDSSPGQNQISPLSFSPLGGNLAGPLNMPAKHWSEEGYYNYRHESKDSHSAPLDSDNRASLQMPREDRRSEDYLQSNRNSRRYSPLPPRFYSPSDRSVQLFADGETPSKNVSAPSCPFLFLSPARLGEIAIVALTLLTKRATSAFTSFGYCRSLSSYCHRTITLTIQIVRHWSPTLHCHLRNRPLQSSHRLQQRLNQHDLPGRRKGD